MPSMRPSAWLVPLLLSLVPGACASGKQTGGGSGELAPFPYTPDQIRRANPPKTVLVYRMEGGHNTFIQTTSFLQSSDPGRATIQIKRIDEKGSLLARPEKTTPSWVELRDHASFPAERTVRTEERVETPAGSFDCWLYTVRGDEAGTGGSGGLPVVARFWFALDQPGPPVIYETKQDGHLLSRMTLLERRQP